jgi:hypothetical protein
MLAAAFHDAIGNWSSDLPHQRVRVYRNNVAAALVNALRVRFPVTERLVGTEFFAMMALAYAERNRPASPVLIEYGGRLPDFIRGFAPANSVAYLGDAAQLDDLWWRAYHAADRAALATQALAAKSLEELADSRFELHDSIGLMQSAYAIGDIWHAHHGGPPMPSLTLDRGQCVLVARPLADVTVTAIAPSRHAFLASLASGAVLADAAEQTADHYPDFDIAASLRWFFSSGIITRTAA